MYLVEEEEVRDMWATLGNAEGGLDVNADWQFGSLVTRRGLFFSCISVANMGSGGILPFYQKLAWWMESFSPMMEKV